MTRETYRTMSLPKDLMDEVEAIAQKQHYSSMSEFVKDAIRRRLAQISKENRASNQ